MKLEITNRHLGWIAFFLTAIPPYILLWMGVPFYKDGYTFLGQYAIVSGILVAGVLLTTALIWMFETFSRRRVIWTIKIGK